jgi:uncharacterized protein
MTQKLSLFPLNTVLYPGVQILLHIFEERYRLMIARCLEESMPFGIVLIRSGSEVDPNDAFIQQIHELDDGRLPDRHTETIPYTVGTVARIAEAHRLDDGRYYVTVVGVRRFRIQYLLHQRPYLLASVGQLPEQTSPDLPAQAVVLRELYGRYWEVVERATGKKQEVEELPEDPLELSYVLAHRMQVDLSRKQRWLEADVQTRMRELSAAIQTELSLIPDMPSRGNEPWTWN